MKPAPNLVQLHETATLWYFRRQDAAWSQDDETAFTAWLQADPAHRQVYQNLMQTWDDFSGLARPSLASDSTARCKPRAQTMPPGAGFLARLLGGRLLVPALLSACAVVVTGGWFAWDNTPRYRLDLATAHGQTRMLDLPDGSQIALNIDSAVQVRYYPRRREVVLDRGEVFFRVAADKARPFTVSVDTSEVRVVGTAFNVRSAPPLLAVNVLEGRVEVRADKHDRANLVVLGAGQGVIVDPATRQYQQGAVNPDTVGDWRTGQLAFRRSPLPEVAQELSRYLGVPIILADSSLNALQVSGFASTRTPQDFLEALPDLLPVRVQRQIDGAYRISAR